MKINIDPKVVNITFIAVIVALIVAAITMLGLDDRDVRVSNDFPESPEVELGEADIVTYDVSDFSHNIDNVIDEGSKDLQEVAVLAMQRIGYVPEGVDVSTPEVVTPTWKHPGYIISSLDEIAFLSATVFTKNNALFEISGAQDIPAGALCHGSSGEIFACEDWVLEGVQTILDVARDFRCQVSAGPSGIEAEATSVNCDMNIDGDWFDYAEWAIGNGYAQSSNGVGHAGLNKTAIESPKGVWRAGYNPSNIIFAPEHNRFSTAFSPDPDTPTEVSGIPR